MGVNPLKHPVYDLLPRRTQAKLLSPVSEDKLTWDCFFGLLRAGELGTVLARLLKVPDKSFEDARLVLWGFEIREDGASVWEPLREVLSAVENYRDGKPEGQKTEPDVTVCRVGPAWTTRNGRARFLAYASKCRLVLATPSTS